MPRAAQRQPGSVPKPVEVVNNATTSDHRAAQLMSKDPQDTFECILNGLDRMIQEETSNATRRANIQLCRHFVSEHGFPKEDHYVWVKDGVVTVLTEEERTELPGSPSNVNNFLLCAPEWDIH